MIYVVCVLLQAKYVHTTHPNPDKKYTNRGKPNGECENEQFK